MADLLVGFLTWRAAREPIPALLRATTERAASERTSLAVLDVLLLAVVGSAVLVALTSTESSLLVLLTPALLALAGAVLVSRLAIWLIGKRGQRWLMRRPSTGLAAIEARSDSELDRQVSTLMPYIIDAIGLRATFSA